MNKAEILALKVLRRLYAATLARKAEPYDRGVTDPDTASEMIYRLLASGRPCMVARYGSTEMAAVTNYIGVTAKHHSAWKYIQGRPFPWWWEKTIMDQMTRWSGFFPSTAPYMARFGEMMVEDSKMVDILGSWLPTEETMKELFALDFEKVMLRTLEPYWAKDPWTRVLEGKRVIVVHPFAPLIERQYKENRERLFRDRRVLPEFSLRTVQAVQSLGGKSTYHDWFEALEAMKAEMDATDYDIALIGCGAYGFPLAAHAKRTGHQAVHLGGALQLLFGIRGKRWDQPGFGYTPNTPWKGYASLFNEYWVYPGNDLRPATANEVEGACYW